MTFVKQIAHACMMTHDLAASEHFYCDVLGLKKAFEFNKGGKRIGLYIEAGARTWIEIFDHKDAPFPSLGAINHFCLEVTSMDEAIKHIRASLSIGIMHSRCHHTITDHVRVATD